LSEAEREEYRQTFEQCRHALVEELRRQIEAEADAPERADDASA
jgi:hypothetical protein